MEEKLKKNENFIRAQRIRLDLFIPLPLFTFEVAWFCGEGTSLISDIHIEFAPSGFRVELFFRHNATVLKF